MKKANLVSGFRSGLVFGIVLVFLFLIGFLETGAGLLSKFFGDPVPTNTLPKLGYVILFLALMAIWSGSGSSKKINPDRFSELVLPVLVNGGVLGLMTALMALIFGNYVKAGVDVRNYLVAVSPASIKMLMLNLTEPVQAALALFALMTVATFLGALLHFVWNRHLSEKVKRTVSSKIESVGQSKMMSLTSHPAARYIALAGALALFFFLPRMWGSYWNYVLGTVGIYILLGIGLNLITGWTGQLVIGYVSFFGIGAYTFSLLTAPEPHAIMMNFWLALLIAVAVSALVGFLIGLPILNLRGDYLAIVTLGFAEIVRILLKSDLLTSFTGGPRGIRDIGGPTLFGADFSSDVNFIYLIFVMVILIAFVANRLQRSRTGRAWEAIREDQTVAKATGINTFSSKLLALTLSAAVAGLAGVLFASRNQFTGPEDHILLVSINVICLMIVGGVGNIPGIIIGALALKGLPELLREVSNFRMLTFGALLVMMMLIRPDGFLPARRPRMKRPMVEDPQEKAEEGA